MFQDQEQSLIADFALSKCRSIQENRKQFYVALAIGNGEVAVLKIATSIDANDEISFEVVEACRNKLSDIKLLSCFIIKDADQDNQFDIVGANGRAELIKTTFDTVTQTLSVPMVFKADQKVQFTAVQLFEAQDRLVCGDTRGNLWLFDYSTGETLS